MVLILLGRGGTISLLDAEVVLEGSIIEQCEWAWNNPLIVVESDALEVINLCKKDTSFFELDFLVKDILYVGNCINYFLFYHPLERRTNMSMP